MLSKLLKRQSAWSLFDQCMVSGSNFISLTLLIRWLDNNTFSLYAIISMIIIFFMSFQTALIIAPTINFSSKLENESRTEYINHILMFQLFYGIIIIGITPLCYIILKSYQWHVLSISTMLFIAIFISLKLMHEFIRKYYYLDRSMKPVLFGDGILSVTFITLIVLLYKLELLTFKAIILSHIGALVLSLLCMFYHFKWEVTYLSKLKMYFIDHWKFGKWLLAKAIVQWWGSNYFILAAIYIYGQNVAGLIKSSQNIIGVIGIFFLALENFIPIRAAQAYHKNGILGLKKYLKRITVYGGLITLTVSFLVLIFRKELVWYIYNNQNEELIELLFWMSLMPIVTFIGLPIRIALRTIDFTRPLFTSYLIVSILSLIFAKPLVSSLGINAVAYGMIGSQAIMNIWCLYSFYRKLKK
jgi:O-antigen/teichoic acid export membrane protein